VLCSVEHGARSVERGAWSVERGVWRVECEGKAALRAPLILGTSCDVCTVSRRSDFFEQASCFDRG